MIHLGWFAFWFVAMSFIEHFAHRRLMHRKGLLHRWFPGVYERHAVQHHRRYYRVFNHEPDPVGRELNLRFEVLPSLPIALVVAAAVGAFSAASAVMLLLAVLAHHLIWNAAHSEMHDPKGRFFSGWRLYRGMARYHWMHHRYPGRNYNVVLPLADFVWRTRMRPSPADVAKMEELGL